MLAVGGAKVSAMMDSLAEQAEQLGADAVVGVRTTLAATSGQRVMTGVMTGTAVRTIR